MRYGEEGARVEKLGVHLFPVVKVRVGHRNHGELHKGLFMQLAQFPPLGFNAKAAEPG